ncbi:hypothetical protein [Paeniglutamicibacter sp. Y32M11]|uniref:hypothetical protein n=1 Tax=Paeniglutamicibacter sp. Y32M11 TaxID=2853258 RepID=UPI001C530F99|nr:hypothetical protein [Paeniglutamicibacter sp. Y32M11]QXQ09859.1 hypothetical protein KUF55_15645 [Paeniglutamicibacter sp. Y32M11]
MFISTRRKTAGEHRSATNLRTTADTVQESNHWAWTGWMPEMERELSQPTLQSSEHFTSLLAA